MRPFRLPASVYLWPAAVVTGALAASAALLFRAAINVIATALTGVGGSLVAAATALAPWHRALVVTAGGLMAGLVLHWGLRWAARGPAGAESIDYIDAARQGTVALNDRATFVRSVSSLLSVSTGASIGREGAMVQLAAWFASLLARLFPFSAEHRDALLVCGIASGIGAAYHAPIAGVVFVLELALGFLARNTVAPVLLAAATSSGLIYWFVEPRPLYEMPAVALAPASIGIAILAGLVCGGIGWMLLSVLERSRAIFAALAPSLPTRFGLGSLLVGLLSAAVPEVWGNGYSVVSTVLQGGSPWAWVAVIFAAKVVATILSAGSGAIGGVFTPTLFVCATSGYLMACITPHIASTLVADPRVVAVIGMAAVLAAVTHAPLMAIVIVLEMTNQFQLTLPVLVACGLAYAVSTHFGARPLYGNPIEGRQ